MKDRRIISKFLSNLHDKYQYRFLNTLKKDYAIYQLIRNSGYTKIASFIYILRVKRIARSLQKGK